jgi:hypothetical protein
MNLGLASANSSRDWTRLLSRTKTTKLLAKKNRFTNLQFSHRFNTFGSLIFAVKEAGNSQKAKL